ncbi:helix-turn-helix transcriptional regulator [Rubinisphaera sp. JC750]|uniref:helix-turn-helix transcriptional regulator n=1 Tax=Rubinisphaera sp. JC750 TaxID=2898658 RepID=UPI0039656148
MVLTQEELRKILRVSRGHFRKLRKSGKLPKPLGDFGSRSLRWSRAAIDQWLCSEGGA